MKKKTSKPELTEATAKVNVEAVVMPAPIVKGRKRFCPECGEKLVKEIRKTFWNTEEKYYRCTGLIEPEYNHQELEACTYEVRA